MIGKLRRRSLRVRLAVAAGVGAVVGLVCLGLFLESVFRATVEAAFDERLTVIQRTLLSYAEVDEDAGALILGYDGDEPRFNLSYQGWYWQVTPESANATANSPLIQRSKSLEDWSLKVARPKDVGIQASGNVHGPLGQQLRFINTAYKLHGGGEERFFFAVAGDYSEVTRQIARFRSLLWLSLFIMLLVLSGVLVAQIAIATSPLRRMRRALADVRNGEADRLEGAFLSEVQPLINDLNGLLDTNAEIIERARTQVGNLAHALKTPLSVLNNASNADTDPPAGLVSEQTNMMRTQIDHYLSRARAAASVNVIGVKTPVAERLRALMLTMSKIHSERGLKFEMDCDDAVVFKGESHDLDEMLGNLVDNACIWAHSEVLAEAALSGEGRLVVCVSDDGPGLPEAERSRVLQRGHRLDETKPGSGLGLSIVSDMAQLYSGSLSLEESTRGGLKAVLELPAFLAQDK